MRKTNSNVENPSKRVSTTLSNPMIHSPVKQTRSMSNPRTESNSSHNILPSSNARSVASFKSKLDQPNEQSQSNNDSLKNPSVPKFDLSTSHSQLINPNRSHKSGKIY